MLNLQRMSLFIAVVDSGSFTAAAAASGQTKAVVSFNIRQLEKELGVTLLLRSTRRLTLTDAGVLFYQKGVNLLNAAKNLQDEVRATIVGWAASYVLPLRPSLANRWSFRYWRSLVSAIPISVFGICPHHIMPI